MHCFCFQRLLFGTRSNKLKSGNMATEHWLDHNLINIVFEGRNKSYGAYALRISYYLNMTRGMIAGISLFTIIILSPMVLKTMKNPQIKEPIFSTHCFFEPPPTIPKIDDPKPEPSKPIQKTSPLKTKIKYLPPKVVKDPDEVDEDPPPTKQELFNNYSGNIGNDTAEATGIDELFEPPGENASSASIIEEEVKTIEFISVEQKPEFPGGMKALGKYIQDNLDLTNNRINESAQVRFIVDETGFVKDVVVIRSSSIGFERAVLKVIKEMPQWKSGKHNGKAVQVVFILPVKVQLQ